MAEDTATWAAFRPCGCLAAAISERLGAAAVQQAIGAWVMAGLRAERVTAAQVREGCWECAVCGGTP